MVFPPYLLFLPPSSVKNPDFSVIMYVGGAVKLLPRLSLNMKGKTK